jgi:two-component system chemotaxis response regulator CheB
VTDYFTKSMFNTASLSRLLGLITVRRRRVTERLLEEFERERAVAVEGTPARSLTVVGGSAGALQMATRAFDRRIEVGDGALLYVSHASRRADSSLMPVLRNADPRFRWSRPDALVESGGLYVAPPGFDLGFAGERFRLVVSDAYPGTVPSLDVAYRLAAETYGNRLTIAVLAGLNDDGAAGAARAAEAGAQVLVVDPRDLGSSGEMGRAVIDAVPAARVIGVTDLEQALEKSAQR